VWEDTQREAEWGLPQCALEAIEQQRLNMPIEGKGSSAAGSTVGNQLCA